MGRYNSSTLWRLYQIGGPDLALRYAELSSAGTEPEKPDEYAKGSKLEVVDLRFFAGGPPKPELSAREFASRFPTRTTKYVYYQLDLRSPWRYSSLRYTARVRYYDSANVMLSEITDEFKTRPDEPRFSRSGGCGKDQPGNWAPGAYRVELEIDYQRVRTAEFTIFDDRAESLAELFGNRSAKAPWELPKPRFELPGLAPKRGRRKP